MPGLVWLAWAAPVGTLSAGLAIPVIVALLRVGRAVRLRKWFCVRR